MSLIKTWYTLEEAESKFGLTRALLLEWVDEGVVRSEQSDKTVIRVNGDDIELLVAERSMKS